MSENYFQHADHFTRILSEQENYRKEKFSAGSLEKEKISDEGSADQKIEKEEVVDKNEDNKANVAVVK